MTDVSYDLNPDVVYDIIPDIMTDVSYDLNPDVSPDVMPYLIIGDITDLIIGRMITIIILFKEVNFNNFHLILI